MTAVAKVDSKGRICIPAELRQELTDIVTVQKTAKGLLIVQGGSKDFLAEFKNLLLTKPRRTGKPENWSPARMKGIWKKVH